MKFFRSFKEWLSASKLYRTNVPPLIIALKLIGKFPFSFSHIKNDIASLKPMSKEVKHMFFHSNTPEVYTLYAHHEYEKLDRLVKRFVVTNVAIGLLFLIGIILFIKPFIVLFAKPEYLDALPNLYIQLSTLLLVVPFTVLFPLTVTINEIKRLHIAKSISITYLVVVAYFGMNAVTLATAGCFYQPGTFRLFGV